MHRVKIGEKRNKAERYIETNFAISCSNNVNSSARRAMIKKEL